MRLVPGKTPGLLEPEDGCRRRPTKRALDTQRTAKPEAQSASPSSRYQTDQAALRSPEDSEDQLLRGLGIGQQVSVLALYKIDRASESAGFSLSTLRLIRI